MIRFNADTFRKLTPFVSKEETRYYLNGIHVAPHPQFGVVLSATDGHRAVVAWDQTGTATESAIIKLSPEAIKACKPAKVKYGSETRFVEISLESDQHATVFIEGVGEDNPSKPVAVSHDVRIDGTFPNLPAAINSAGTPPYSADEDKPKDWTIGAFNSAYVESFAKLGKELDSVVRIVSRDKSYPALVLFPSAPELFGVIMPMRADDESTSIPAWYTAEKEESKAA